MPKKTPLGSLIASLQNAISEGSLNEKFIKDATTQLCALGYRYDDESFPPLIETENFTNTCSSSPEGLAEALLWKLGKWKAYKKFCNDYFAENGAPTKSNVVFYAFAIHLRDKDNPIYDQHAIRSLWAICGKLTADEREKCRSLLFNKKSKWKQSGTGKHSIECYQIYVKHINILTSDVASKGVLDRLLMPLGQAIKESTKTYADFDILCDWHAVANNSFQLTDNDSDGQSHLKIDSRYKLIDS